MLVSALGLSGCNESESTALPDAVAGPAAITQARNMIYVSIGRYDNMRANLDKYMDIITDYNISFLNPHDSATGEITPLNEQQRSDLDYLIEQVRNKKPDARIYLVFGGWRGTDYDLVYEKIASNDEARHHFINEIMKLVNEYGVDGIDMDWEYPREAYAKQYAFFIRELSNALHKEGKRLSAAVIGLEHKKTDNGNGAAYLDSVLSDLDNVNLMAYDVDFDNHSTYQMAVDSINYWVHKRGVTPIKAILGLPGYARPGWVDYTNLVKVQAEGGVATGSPDNACRDSFVHDGVINYYNGLPTIMAKTKLAMNSGLGGVMLWELPLDTNVAELSIIKAVNTTQHNTGFLNYCDINSLP